jgi:nucleotide-binding universal stress UspA family protein
MGISKMVIGYDPSDRAERAFSTGVEIAVALGADVHLVTAFSDSPKGKVEITDERQQAELMLNKAAGRITVLPSSKVHLHAIPTRPAEAIVEVARETGADIIVIGNRGAQGVSRVLGSVASAVIGHAPCTVMVVKTD